MTIFTLDAGGTNLIFQTVKDGKIFGDKISMPTKGENLEHCLKNIIKGFEALKVNNNKPDAISFAFPGPADYKNGIIGDLYNIPSFRGGVALGKMLEEIFQVPVFINNDGDLYAFGEAICGSLPKINEDLSRNNNTKQYQNITGFTIGTGFGAGIVHNKHLFIGDNICAGEIWITSNRVDKNFNSEEGVSIRAVRHFYSMFANLDFKDSPDPLEIYEIAKGNIPGNIEAAKSAYKHVGRFIGDAIANIVTLTDGLVVIGGGVAGAKEFISPGIKEELQNKFKRINGEDNPRLAHTIYNINDADEYKEFLRPRAVKIKVPFSTKEVYYDKEPRVAYFFSEFKTDEMISLGAYHYAVKELSKLQ